MTDPRDLDLANEPEDEDEDEDFDPNAPMTSADFHNVTQKLIMNAVSEALAEAKLSWDVVLPFLESGREMARADFEAAQVRLHTLKEEEGRWVDAEEAFLGISVADRDEGGEWLAETWWVSELATAEDDPEKVRAIIAGLERSLARMRAWLAEKEGGAGAPPSDTQPS